MIKRIVIFYPHISEYGGIERNIIALAESIEQNGYNAVLVCFYDNIGMTQYHENLEIVVLGDHNNPVIKTLRFQTWFKKNKCLGLPLFFGGKAGFYGGILRIKSYALHYTDPPSLLSATGKEYFLKKLVLTPKHFLSEWLTSKGVARAKVLLTMTYWNASELKEIYGRTFNVIYQGGIPATQNVNDSPRCLGPILRLFSICRLASSKNLDWILEIINHLHSDTMFKCWFQNFEVIIAGIGPEYNSLKDQATRLGINDLVQFPGFLNEKQVEEEYRKADIFLVPGRQGYGLPVLEALYRRVPVVLNKESRISEILEDNPWVAISENSCNSFRNTVIHHISQLKNKYPEIKLLKNLPTEQEWAFAVGKKCGWW